MCISLTDCLVCGLLLLVNVLLKILMMIDQEGAFIDLMNKLIEGHNSWSFSAPSLIEFPEDFKEPVVENLCH